MVLAIIGMLAAGIFTIIGSTFQLTSELKAHQDRNETKHRLLEIVETNLLALPAETRFELEVSQGGGLSTGAFRLGNAPLAFQQSGEIHNPVRDVVMRSGKGRGGFIQVTLHYLDRDQARRFEQNDRSILESAPSILLADRLRKFEWRLYDPRTQKWVKDWKSTDPRPSMAELSIAHEGDRTEQRMLFWIPPRRAQETRRTLTAISEP